MKIADIKVGEDALGDIILWGCGGQKVLIDALYSKAEEIKGNKIADEIMFIVSTLETQTEAFRAKLQELDKQYVTPLERELKEATQ
jgi:hypothetical protein